MTPRAGQQRFRLAKAPGSSLPSSRRVPKKPRPRPATQDRVEAKVDEGEGLHDEGTSDSACQPRSRASALDGLPCAALVTDAQQRIVYANAAFVEVTGYQESELLGMNCGSCKEPTPTGTPWRDTGQAGAGQGFRGRS